MEAIKTYLDNVFAAFPQTNEIQTLKRDMLANMEEKYTALRQSGKSEHEAAYSVIANFGDMEEIIAELKPDMKSETMGTGHKAMDTGHKAMDTDHKAVDTDHKAVGTNHEAVGTDHKASGATVFVSRDEARTYLSKSKKRGVLIGSGVWLIIAGASSVLVLDNVFVLFPSIATAVAIFIVAGSMMSAYESFDETPVWLDDHTREMVESERTGFITQCSVMIAVGVGLIILAAGCFTVINFPVPLFLNIVGFSVFLFIIAGSYRSAYDILLGRGDYADKTAYKQAGRIVGTVAAVYWPTVGAIFLLWSFTRDAWGISWMIWPVAGILFGAVSAGVAVWFGTKETRNEQ